MISILIGYTFVSALASWLCILIIYPILKKYLLDHPGARSSHKYVVPRGGGIAFVLVGGLGNCLGLYYQQIYASYSHNLSLIPLICTPLALIGLLDDLYKLKVLIRYIGQLATGIALINISPLGSKSMEGIVPLVLCVVAITYVINLTNFMDGVDGLVAGCMIIIILTSTVYENFSLGLFTLVGALIGFTAWNWSPAKIFMGDVGSTYLGAVFAGLVVQAENWSSAMGMLLLGTPLIADASICLVRRLASGQNIFEAHRLHLYQRLHQAGWAHDRVAIVYIAATLLLSLSLLLGGLSSIIAVTCIVTVYGIWLDQNVAISFNKSIKM